MALKEPNHTQFPNEIIDDYLSLMGDAELRVVMVIVRKTKGYHKQKDYISINKLMDLTGLSKNGVKSGLKAAIERGIIRRATERGMRGIAGYELNYSSSEEITTGSVSDPVQGQPVTLSASATGSASDPTKEKDSLKENNKRKPLTKVKTFAEVEESFRKKQIAEVIAAHLASGVTDPKAYAKKGKRDLAAQILDAGFTPEDVRQYIHYLKTKPDKFWLDKGIDLHVILKNIGAWKQMQSTQPSTPRFDDMTFEERDRAQEELLKDVPVYIPTREEIAEWGVTYEQMTKDSGFDYVTAVRLREEQEMKRAS